MRKKNILIVAVIVLMVNQLFAQSTIGATGGDAASTGGSVSYTVGQIDFNRNLGNTGSSSEGVQQSFETYIVSGIHKFPGINLKVLAFPNPTTRYLTLELNEHQAIEHFFLLYNQEGKLLENMKISSSTTMLDFYKYPTAIYYLHVRNESCQVASFKIIKK